MLPIRGRQTDSLPILKRASSPSCPTQPQPPWWLKPSVPNERLYLFCAVKVSLCRCGPLYTTLLSPWLAKAPSVRAMEPMAEGWQREEDVFTFTFLQKHITSVCVYGLSVLLTSWYTDGLEREGTVKDNTLLCPSLSTISCERKKTGRQRNNVSVSEKKKTAFFPCHQPLKSVCLSLQAHSSVMCGRMCVDLRVCVSPAHSVGVCLWVCVVWKSTRQSPGFWCPPVDMLMSERLMGARRCVEWQLTYSAIQTGS